MARMCLDAVSLLNIEDVGCVRPRQTRRMEGEKANESLKAEIEKLETEGVSGSKGAETLKKKNKELDNYIESCKEGKPIVIKEDS